MSKLDKKRDSAIIKEHYDIFQNVIDTLCSIILKDIEVKGESPAKAISESRQCFLDFLIDSLEEED